MNDRRPANVSLPDEAAASADTTPGRDEDVQDARSASVIDVEARGWGCPVDTVGRILMDASPKMFTDPPPRPRKVGRKRQLLLLGCGFAVGFLLGSRAGRPTYQWLFAHSQALLKSDRLGSSAERLASAGGDVRDAAGAAIVFLSVVGERAAQQAETMAEAAHDLVEDASHRIGA